MSRGSGDDENDEDDKPEPPPELREAGGMTGAHDPEEDEDSPTS